MNAQQCIAFAGSRLIAVGELSGVAQKAKKALDRDASAQVLIFDDASSELIEVDLRGTAKDVEERLRAPAVRRRRCA